MTRARDVATQGGLVLLTRTTFSAVTTISINNVFTSAYDNYRVVFDATASVVGQTPIYFRYRANGVDNSSSNYEIASFYVRSNAGTGAWATGGGGNLFHMITTEHNNGYCFGQYDFYKPATTVTTKKYVGIASMPMSGTVGQQTVLTGGAFWGADQFDGFTFYPSQGNFTGTISVYGYRN